MSNMSEDGSVANQRLARLGRHALPAELRPRYHRHALGARRERSNRRWAFWPACSNLRAPLFRGLSRRSVSPGTSPASLPRCTSSGPRATHWSSSESIASVLASSSFAPHRYPPRDRLAADALRNRLAAYADLSLARVLQPYKMAVGIMGELIFTLWLIAFGIRDRAGRSGDRLGTPRRRGRAHGELKRKGQRPGESSGP
jgi:hypothetical protein